MALPPLRRGLLTATRSATTTRTMTTSTPALSPGSTSTSPSSHQSLQLSFQDVAQPLTPPPLYRPTDGKRPPHWLNDGANGSYNFEAPWPSWKPRITSFWSFLQARYIDEGREEWKEKPLPKTVAEGLPAVKEATWREEGGATVGEDKLRMTWLGHASCHLQVPVGNNETINILMDPVFSSRCSPISFMGPQRFTPPPTSVEAMSKSDQAWPHVVVLSHNHYDHMDYATIKALLSRPNGREQPLWLVPLGLKAWFEANCKELDSDKVVELDWWGEKVVSTQNGGEMTFTCTPAQHFGARSTNDRGKTLWASWAMHVPNGARVWFSGDTGYRSLPRNFKGDEESLPSCPAFREIGELLGPFDLALVACGAYQPRSMFSSVHVNPREAVTIHEEVRARRSVGIHHSTWRLTSEDVDEPARLFKEEGRKKGLKEGEVDCLGIGETRVFGVGAGGEGGEGQRAAL